MKDPGIFRIIVVGVGGQGVVFASKVIGEAVLNTGTNVVMSEVHGMAQRGGVVTCHVCIGDVRSPIVGDGQADVILSFEPIEAYRVIRKANSDTIIITNKAMFIPVSVNTGDVKYPELSKVISSIEEVNGNLIVLNATKMAIIAGSHVMANAVMLGALAGTGRLPIDNEELKKHMLSKVPPKTRELNSKAYDMGFEITSAE